MASNYQKKHSTKAKDEVWDIINPARVQPHMPRKQKSETMTPVRKEDLVLPQITPKPRHEEPEDTKEDPPYKTPKWDIDPYSTGRLRELEILVLDTRGQLEKRMRQLVEELPSKLQRELTAIQNRDAGMWKDMQTKTAGLQESLSILKESYKALSGSVNDKLSALQRRADETELRLISVEKGAERAGGAKGIATPKTGDAMEGKVFGQVQIELSSVKEQLLDDKRKRDSQIDELSRNLSDLDARLRSQINSMAQGLSRLNDVPKTSGESNGSVPAPPGLTKGEIEYMNSQMMMLEKKVDEEMGRRIKLEEDLLKYLDEKVLGLKDKQKQEEKGSLEREKKMLGNIQEGLVTINDILKGTNEETGLKLTKVETELSHNLEALTQLVDNTNRTFATDIAREGEDLKTLQQKVADLEESSVANLQSVSTAFQNEIFRLETKLMESNKAVAERHDEVSAEVQRQEKLLSAVKDDVMNVIAQERKETDKGLAGVKTQVEAANNFVRESTVMMKYNVDEGRKANSEKCAEVERNVTRKVDDIDHRIGKKVDDFTVFVDDRLRAHSAKTDDDLTKQKESIESFKKSTDEHIRQQANSIRALSRAFAEKEGAERKLAVEELGLRFAKRFAQIEADTNKRFINMEVDIKNFAEKKTRDMEQSIMADIQPRLVMDKILTALEGDEQKQKIEVLEKTLQDHIEAYTKQMTVFSGSLKKLDSGLKSEAVTRAIADKELTNVMAAKDAVNGILSSLSDMQIAHVEKANAARFTSLEQTCDSIETRISKQSKNNNQLLGRLENEIKEEIIKSTTNQIATAAAINAVELKLRSEIDETKRTSNTNNDELTKKIAETKAQLEKDILFKIKANFTQTAATSAVEQLANKVALNAIESKLDRELEGAKTRLILARTELSTLIDNKTSRIDELFTKLEGASKTLEEFEQKNGEIKGYIAAEIVTAAKAQEGKSAELSAKLEELNTNLEEYKKTAADASAKGADQESVSKISKELEDLKTEFEEYKKTAAEAGAKGADEESVTKISKELEELKTEFEEYKKTAAEAEAKGADESASKMGKELEELKQKEEEVGKRLVEISSMIEPLQKKNKELEDQIAKVHETEAKIVADNKKVQQEVDSKFQATVGTMNNEVESLNKRFESDISQTRIDIDRKFDDSVKGLESRIKALEVAANKQLDIIRNLQ